MWGSKQTDWNYIRPSGEWLIVDKTPIQMLWGKLRNVLCSNVLEDRYRCHRKHKIKVN